MTMPTKFSIGNEIGMVFYEIEYNIMLLNNYTYLIFLSKYLLFSLHTKRSSTD